MDRRSFVKRAGWAGIAAGFSSAAAFADTVEEAKAGAHTDAQATTKTASPETLLLKDYRPKSIYKIPVTEIAKAKFPVIDMHSHPYAKTEAEIDDWVRNMDEVGIEKTMILTMSTGAAFDEIQRKYAKYPERFEMWCGFDFTGYDKPGFGPGALVRPMAAAIGSHFSMPGTMVARMTCSMNRAHTIAATMAPIVFLVSAPRATPIIPKHVDEMTVPI